MSHFNDCPHFLERMAKTERNEVSHLLAIDESGELHVVWSEEPRSFSCDTLSADEMSVHFPCLFELLSTCPGAQNGVCPVLDLAPEATDGVIEYLANRQPEEV